MKHSNSLSNEKSIKDEILYKDLYLIPPKKGRYIVIDTETTGLKKNDHVVELGAHEILDGKLTGAQFHIYIRPRVQMEEIVINIHQITNNYYSDFIAIFNNLSILSETDLKDYFYARLYGFINNKNIDNRNITNPKKKRKGT